MARAVGRPVFPAHAGMDRPLHWKMTACRCFPRTRGDGPCVQVFRQRRTGFSPHTRGWTDRVPVALDPRTVFPAHAGMDRCRRAGRRVRHCFPRTRGDGPFFEAANENARTFSPHTRGWTDTGGRAVFECRVFPAHAGMDRVHFGFAWCQKCFPRTRGDGPATERTTLSCPEFSPHTRGWTGPLGVPILTPPVFPAHAGMDRYQRAQTLRRGSFPRTRGDGPTDSRRSASSIRFSPHTRGWTAHGERLARWASVFPAHAGMDQQRLSLLLCVGRFPRTRGDGPNERVSMGDAPEFSPHTRGWTRCRGSESPEQAVFPAHAGMDRRVDRIAQDRVSFPRTRGDGPKHGALWAVVNRFSPHTRGWTGVYETVSPSRAVFPAHAGMDRTPACIRQSGRRFPRTRGDGPSAIEGDQGGMTFSPHTRGWTARTSHHSHASPVFPAHAGMDRSEGCRTLTWRSFPRTRGDGPWPAVRGGHGVRFSPHTRGWTEMSIKLIEDVEVFPAHAGMDRWGRWGRGGEKSFPRTRGDGPRKMKRRPTRTEFSPHTRGWTGRDRVPER